MKLVYIAGPYRAPTPWGVEQNIRRAETYGLYVARLGGFPVIPHANCRYFQGQCTDEFWLRGTMKLLERCDALVLIPGWRGSSGTGAEAERALVTGLSIFNWEIVELDADARPIGAVPDALAQFLALEEDA